MSPTTTLERPDTRGHPQILLMEDETNLAKGLQMVLEEEGYEVAVAITGESALEKLGRHYFDLILADLRLPDMDGMDVVKQVKEQQPETEAIIITGYPTVASAVASSKIGVYEYLRKPFSEDELKSAINGALKHKEEASIEDILVKTEQDRLIQKEEVIRVLDKTSTDISFWQELMENGSSALKGYHLSMEAKAAIVSGDLDWIRLSPGKQPWIAVLLWRPWPVSVHVLWHLWWWWIRRCMVA